MSRSNLRLDHMCNLWVDEDISQFHGRKSPVRFSIMIVTTPQWLEILLESWMSPRRAYLAICGSC